MYKLHYILPFTLLLFLHGCSGDRFRLPGVYRIDIQQGNVIDQDMIDRLRPGMHKDQVYFLLGTPAIVDPFHTNQWEYIYSMSKRGRQRHQHHLRIYFEEDRLAYIDGDVVASMRPPAEPTRHSKTVEVPPAQRSGFFGRITDAIPFVGKDSADREDAGDSPEQEK